MEHSYYLHQTEKWMNEGKCPETVVRNMNALIDKEVMQPLMVADKEKYWNIMRDLHSMCEGNHYNEAFAMWEVAQMQHKGSDGKIYKGAHWSIEEVMEVYNKYKAKLKETDNVYDMYVALNKHFKDNHNLYKSWFPEDYESKIIDSAINFYFEDDDMPDKIWKYFRCNK